MAGQYAPLWCHCGTTMTIWSAIMSEIYLSIKDVADRFKVSIRTLRRMRAMDQMPPAKKIGRELRWAESALEKWFDKRPSV
jgi:predicted DNA-binding transcriptional regulator AlpA